MTTVAAPEVLALPTVSDVLVLPELQRGGARVVAGATGLHRPVRWVHVAEISDIAHLLTGGELLLTTGIALPKQRSGLRAYVDGVADAGVVGVVIELVQRWRDRLPEVLLDAADERELPLVTLARETPFVRVTEAVVTRIRDAQLAELRAAERIHETFTALTVAGAEPEEVLGEVANLLHCPTVLETPSRHVLAYHAAGTDPAELLAGWRERSAAVAVNGRSGYDAGHGWLLTVVGARGDDWGRLVIVTGAPPTHRHTVVAERAASALALNRLVAKEQDTVERQTHAALLTELLTSREPPEDFATRAGALGVPLAGATLVGLAIRPRISPQGQGSTGPAQVLRHALRDVAESAARAARAEGVAALVGVTDETTVHALCALPVPAAGSAVDTVTARIARHIHRGTEQGSYPRPVTVAAGSVAEAAAGARRTIIEAAHVAEAAQDAGEHRDCYRLHDVHLTGLLHLLRDDDRIAAFVDRELAGLRDRPRLLDALRHYCACGGNKSAAAAAAHVSRSTYYAQLATVERILGVRLDSPATVLSLYVALQALDLA